MPRFYDEGCQPEPAKGFSLGKVEVNVGIAPPAPLDERTGQVRDLLDEAHAQLSVLEAKLRPVLVSTDDNPGRAIPPEALASDARTELAGFFVYASARLRDLIERIAYVTDRVDL